MNKKSSQIWKKKLKTVGERLDINDCKMESGIIETVTALNLLKIPTSSSCEGHLDHGEPNPWVDIVAIDKPEELFLEEEEALEYKKWQEENEILAKIVIDLINEFYAGSKPNEQIKISIKPLGYHYLAGRIQAGEKTSIESIKILHNRQAEMKKFTKFLKSKFELSVNE